MAADPARLPHALRNPYPWVRTAKVLYGCLAIFITAIGGLSLVAASPLRQIVESLINIHLLFELLLFTLLIARYRWGVSHSPPTTSIAIKELSRHLSRIVYLMLYGAIGFGAIITLVSRISHGGALDFNLFDEHFRSPPQSPFFNPRDDWQVLLASGLLALLSVRVMAFALWRGRQKFDVAPQKASSNDLPSNRSGRTDPLLSDNVQQQPPF